MPSIDEEIETQRQYVEVLMYKREAEFDEYQEAKRKYEETDSKYKRERSTLNKLKGNK